MLYSLSKELESKVLSEAKRVEEKFKGLIKFDEYIVLPDYGERIIIRFGIMRNDIDDISKLDDIECDIRDILGDDYWGELIGSVYIIFGFNGEVMGEGLKNIDNTVPDNIIVYKETSHGKYIKRDREVLGELLRLSSSQKLWEIQILNGEDVDALIIVVDTEEKTEIGIEKIREEIINIDGKTVRVDHYKDCAYFNGCIKAEFISKLREKALQHIIMDYANHNYI